MIIIYGESNYGKVSHVPGLFYVKTRFAHLYGMPLIPTSSYLVVDGSEKDNGFRGVPIPMDWRSVLAGYIRTLLGGATLAPAFIVGLFGGILVGQVVGVEPEGTVGLIAAFILMFGGPVAAILTLVYILSTPSRRYLPAQLGFLALSGILYFLSYQPTKLNAPQNAVVMEFFRNCLLTVNIAAGLFSLTRLWNRCPVQRALTLGRRLGLTPQEVARHMLAQTEEAETTNEPPPKIPEGFDASNHFAPSQPAAAVENGPADPHEDRIHAG
jgi:hypothetical protein